MPEKQHRASWKALLLACLLGLQLIGQVSGWGNFWRSATSQHQHNTTSKALQQANVQLPDQHVALPPVERWKGCRQRMLWFIAQSSYTPVEKDYW